MKRTYEQELLITAQLFGKNSMFELVSVLEIMADYQKDRQTVEDDLTAIRKQHDLND